MASAIDPTRPADGVPAIKSDLRDNLQAAKAEIEALQTAKTDLGHQHVLADLADAGALAGKDEVATADIANGAITNEKLAPAAVEEANLADGAVGTDKLADLAVTQSKVGSGAIGEANLADAAVTMNKLADNAVGAAKLVAGAVTDAKIAAGAIVEAKLADGAVTNLKLADNAVTQNKIAANAVTQSKIAASSINDSKLADGAVTTTKLGPLAVTQAKLGTSAVSETKLADGAVSTQKLAPLAVTQAKIAPAAVGTSELANGAVIQSKIAAAAVGADQLQDGIPIAMQGALLSGPEIRDYSETSPTATVVGGVLTLDLETGSVFDVTLTANVASLVLANPPAAGRAGTCTLLLKQDATGGRTVAWPASVRWPGGTPPAVSIAANAVDVYALVTRDGGATWYGFLGGSAFS